MAQMPAPLRNNQVTATSSMMVMLPASENPKNHPSGVCGVSTMRVSFSVTERKVCPGAMTRCSPVTGSIIGSRSGGVFGFCGEISLVAMLRATSSVR